MIARRSLLALAGGMLLAGDSPRPKRVVLPEPSGGDDTAALNAALWAGAGGLVHGPKGARYQVSAPLVVHRGTTLIMSDCAVTLAAGSGCNLLTNAAVTDSGRDANITVIGGSWVRAAGVGGSGPDLHTLCFRRVDHLVLQGLTVKTSGDKYAISLGDVTDATVTRIQFEVQSDGVHIQGPAARTRVSAIRGVTGDDTVAITPRDWQSYDDVSGPVTDTLIEDIDVVSAAALVKVLGGSPETAALRTTVRGVAGRAHNNVIWIGDDTAEWRTTGGRVDELTVEQVAAATVPGRHVVFLNGSNVGRVHVRGLTFADPEADGAVLRVAPLTAATVAELAVEDVEVAHLGAGPLLSVDPTARLQRLRVGRLTVAASAAGATLLRIAGAIDDLNVQGVDAVTPGDSYLLELPDWAASATVRQASLSDTAIIGRGGGLIAATAATHTLPRVAISGAQTTGKAWLADLNTRTDLLLSHVTADDTTGGIARVRSSGAAVVRGNALRVAPGAQGVAVGSGGSVTSYVLELAVDVSRLVRAEGSSATNTNARLPCGAGPVVCTGLTWRNLNTGATY
ncbi:hypothetical protein SAMN05443287_110170 [Micromonospora phaseoli]|uniref:Right handed beta helix region n=1 Tax=Micromonospora phaseoli TaxID=1144548 RepID=A0A1H7CT86_9ACTN|nr:hypothetical protein [Micromonospora phaseoli]PZV91521.1 hypothetical protein CLV64_11140 [Micromonospora phaseoli]GIJ80071.1 hypothetical protein Xph01_45030 [Micromonospora phaseoli]SEJ92781.1 hypothetical protein SAMN05443287_110170 [Micromonospora phaseoli]